MAIENIAAPNNFPATMLLDGIGFINHSLLVNIESNLLPKILCCEYTPVGKMIIKG